MMLEFAYLLALGVIGLCILSRNASELGPLLVGGAAFPVGLYLMTLVQLAMAMINLKLHAITLWVLVLALLGATAAWAHRKPPESWRPILLGGTVAAAAIVAIAIFQLTMHASVLSYDSFDYLAVASNLYRPDTSISSDAISGFLPNYAPLLWLAHAPARLFGQEFLVLLHPLIFLTMLLTTCGLVEACTRAVKIPQAVRAGAILAPALVLSTTPQVIHHAVYIMPNLLTGLTLTISVACLWIADRNKSWTAVIPAAICLAALTIARQEGGLMAAVVLMAFATSEGISWKIKTALGAIVAVIPTLWYTDVILITRGGSDESILTRGGAAMQIGGLWAATLVAGVSAIPSLRPLIRLGAMSMPLVLILAHLAFFIVKPAHTTESIGILLTNALWAPALWGVWWGAAIAVGALALAGDDNVPFGKMLGVTAVSLVLLTDLLGIIRWVPYRLGDQDSGNRMLMHAFPLVWTYLAIRFAWAFQPAATRPAVAT